MKKYLSLVAALALVALCSPLAAIDNNETECAKNERVWLEANAARLPHSFAEILAFPEDERMLAFRHVDAATQSAIWQGQFEAYLAAEGADLSPAQRALVQRASLAATPHLFSLRENDPGFAAAQAPLRQVVEEAKAHYPQEEIVRIFYRLGLQGDGNAKSSLPEQRLVPFCTCNHNFDCGGSFCRYRLCIGVQGCGPGGTEGCVGLCSP